MSHPRITWRVKYQEDLDLAFGREIAARPGGEDLYRCIQCGTCSSTCPLSIYMERTPRQIIAMARAGFKDEVLASHTIWLCTSCYACTVDCPKQIKITDIMYALKQKALGEKVYPARFPIPVLAKEFFQAVRRTGRSNESRIVVRMFLQTRPWKLLGNIRLGLKLLRRGRLALRREKMAGGQAQLRMLLQTTRRLANQTPARSPPLAESH